MESAIISGHFLSVLHLLMLQTMLKAKLHRVTVTHSELEYEGSCAIDGLLLEASGICEFEQIHIYNVNTGGRFVTYAIRAENGTGIISVNGAAARLAAPRDILIICAYAQVSVEALERFRPKLIYVDSHNNITHQGDKIPVQKA